MFHKIISEILYNSSLSNSSKKKELQQLQNEVERALEYLYGGWTFCKECKEYYRSESFFVEQETKVEKVCTYSSPINSGSDEYEEKAIKYTYTVCPKGHREVLDKDEI